MDTHATTDRHRPRRYSYSDSILQAKDLIRSMPSAELRLLLDTLDDLSRDADELTRLIGLLAMRSVAEIRRS